jgi:hypothetical protein
MCSDKLLKGLEDHRQLELCWVCKTRGDRFHLFSREIVPSFFHWYINMEPGEDGEVGRLYGVTLPVVGRGVAVVLWIVFPQGLELLDNECEEEDDKSIIHL